MVIALALAAVGCGSAATKVSSSSERSVVVWSPANQPAKAQALADAECKTRGRYARMIDRPSRDSVNFIFDCVL